jgi:hypothetical protein
MKKIIFLILLLSTAAFAQHKYEVGGASRAYDVRFEVEKCDTDYCYGDLKVRLTKKGQKTAFQEFKLETDFTFHDDAHMKMSVIPYDRQGVIDFGDYNFDGLDDLAIQNGRDGGYGGSSYNIYIFSPRTKKFALDERFSALATGPYSGMFTANKKKKVIEVFSKSGCCWHEEREYKVVNGRPVKIYQMTQDAFSNEKWVIVTTRRLVGRKWKVTVKREKRDQ